MASPWVLKFSRTDSEGYVLLQVSPSGDSALDLNLLATEGEAPYKGKSTFSSPPLACRCTHVTLVRQRKIKDLRAKNSHSSDDEWQNILRYVFNPQSAPSIPDNERKGLEVVTTIGNEKVTITLRNRIDKITQRLGSIELAQNNDAEIQLFEWCGSAIDQRKALEAEQTDLHSKLESAQATIASLDSKLEELVKAKADHEEELISKFVLLLNEKKLKIRSQQRLLSSAKIDPKKMKQMEKTLEGKGRQAQSSRAGKRRADPEADDAVNEDEVESSDGFEKLDVDRQEGIVASSQEASSVRQTTPETETETEPDNDELPEPMSRSSPPLGPSAPTARQTSKKPAASSKSRKRQASKKKSPSPPPPVRELPFAKRGAKGKKAAESAPEPAKTQPNAKVQHTTKGGGGDEEIDSDEDEL
jgi:DNA double-strand break repair and V(D)J recombination protein XRCC4